MTTKAITPLRQRMTEDMNARKLCAGTQRGHILSCRRFAAFLRRSPDTATIEDIRRFQLHLAETGVSICNRNRIMTGLRLLFRVTLRRSDLAEEVYHIREPEKLPLVMSVDESVDEIKRLLAVASSLKTRALLSLGYGCGMRANEIVRLKVRHIDRAQNIIRVEQSKGKDRNVMLTDLTDDLKSIDVPTLVMQGDDDQIVPYKGAALLQEKLLKKPTVKIYPGFPHGMLTTYADRINPDLLAFVRS
jgi:integrase/recombinase XerD